MEKMQENGELNNKSKFKQLLNEMKDNKHFKEFFLFHEEALRTGLERLDKESSHVS